jgi:hypothetical protein
MINWNEVQVEQEIAQERYRIIRNPSLKSVKSAHSDQPRVLRLLAWTGRQFRGLGCALQAFAGEPCS